MRNGLTISAIGHAAFLAWGIVSFAATPLKTEPTESVAVDVISMSEFSTMTAGMKTAPQAETQKPLVEKVAPKNEVKDPTPKVVENKHEIDNSAEAPPPPSPPIPEPKPKPKIAEAKPPEAKPEKLEQKPDPIAEALKHEKLDEKPKPQKDEAAQKQVKDVPTPPKRPPQPDAKPQPKYDPSKIAALLIDKRPAQRLASAGDVLNDKPALGTANGTAAKLSQNELDALRARLRECWTPPMGVANPQDLQIVTNIFFRADGSLSSDPIVTNKSSHPAFRAAAEGVLRAIRRCAPYTFMPTAKYDAWKVSEITFTPND